MIVRLVRKYADVHIALADQALISGVNFITAILLARFLGLNEFGVYALAFLGVELLHTFQHSLIIAPMMSLLPQIDESDRRQYLDALIVGQLLFAVLLVIAAIGVIVLVAWIVTDWHGRELLWPFVTTAFACQLQMYVRRHMFATGANWAGLISDVLRYPTQMAILYYLLTTTTMDAGLCLYVVAGCSAFATLVALGFLRPINWELHFFQSVLIRHWRFGHWYLGSELMRWSTGQLYMVVAGVLLGAAAVGAMRATQNFVGACHILKLGLENVVPIRASAHFKGGQMPALVRYLKRVSLFSGGTVALFLFVVAIAPEFWLELIYGQTYAEYGHLVIWWAAIYLLSFFHTPLQFGLRAVEDTRAIFQAQAVLAVWTVISAYPMIHQLGIIGAMAGILLTDTVQLGLLTHGFLKHLHPQEQSSVSH